MSGAHQFTAAALASKGPKRSLRRRLKAHRRVCPKEEEKKKKKKQNDREKTPTGSASARRRRKDVRNKALQDWICPCTQRTACACAPTERGAGQRCCPKVFFFSVALIWGLHVVNSGGSGRLFEGPSALVFSMFFPGSTLHRFFIHFLRKVPMTKN